MARKNFTDVTIVLDRSGSMSSITEGTIGGINNFIREQQEIPGDGCWTLVQFDDHDHAKSNNESFPLKTYENVSQSKVPFLSNKNYKPRGGTALIDAVCKTIQEKIAELAGRKEEDYPSGVVFVIMTDGMENASKTFSREEMNKLISEQKEKYNWQFLFLGANQDSVAEAAKYGIARGAAMNYVYSNDGAEEVLCCASAGMRSWKADGNQTAASLLLSAKPDSKNISKDAKLPGGE